MMSVDRGSPASDRGRIIGWFYGNPTGHGATNLIPATPLTVLYGLNGAGKSRTLTAIRDAMQGRTSDGRVLVELPTSDGAVRRSISDAIEARGYPDMRTFLRTVWEPEACLGPSGHLTPETFAEGLADEWESDPLIMVAGVGQGEKRGWVLTPGLRTGLDRPFANLAVELIEEGWEAKESKVVSPAQIVGPLPDGETVIEPLLHDLSSSQDDLSADLQSPLALDMLLADDLTAEQLAESTISCLEGHEAQFFDYVVAVRQGDDEGLVLTEEILETKQHLESEANRLLSSILIDAPTLIIEVEGLGSLRQTVRWCRDSGIPIPLEEFSAAESRWAIWAIAEALRLVKEEQRTTLNLENQARFQTARRDLGLEDLAADLSSRNQPSAYLHLIDEPEAALHRAAEKHMVQGLEATTGAGSRFLVASHSPVLLDSAKATVVEVQRSDSWVPRVQALSGVDRAGMDRLGLAPSDLLARTKAFVLVEGQHDQIVLETLLSDELSQLRASILAIRGAAQLSAAKCRFLFDFTEAQVVVMLDNLDTGSITALWDEAKHLVVEDGKDAASSLVLDRLGGRDIEQRVLREFLVAAIEAGTMDRVRPHGLTCGDIIEYLPVDLLMKRAAPWPELRHEHELAKEESPKFKDFKTWLTKTRDADFSPNSIEQAARALDSLPSDITGLLETLRTRSTG